MIKSGRGEGLFLIESENPKPRPFSIYTREVIFFWGVMVKYGNSKKYKSKN